MTEAHFGWMLAWVSWNNVARPDGQFAWDLNQANDLDNVIAGAQAYNLKLLVRIFDVPSSATHDGSTRLSQVRPDALRAFAEAMAQHARGHVHAYQVFNEPNLNYEWGDATVSSSSAAGYVQLLRTAAEGIHAGDPSATVIAAGLASAATAPSMNDLDYLQAEYSAGLRGAADALATHPYGGSSAPEADPNTCPASTCFRRAELQHAIMVANGDSATPMWATEVGWLLDSGNDVGSNFDWMKVSQTTQASYLVDALQYARRNWSWMGPMFVFNLDLSTVSWNPPTSSVYWFAVLNPDGSARQAYSSLASYAAHNAPPPTAAPTSTPVPTAAPTRAPAGGGGGAGSGGGGGGASAGGGGSGSGSGSLPTPAPAPAPSPTATRTSPVAPFTGTSALPNGVVANGTPTTLILTNAGAQLTSTDGTLQVNAGSMASQPDHTWQLDYVSLQPSSVPVAPDGLQIGSATFAIDASDLTMSAPATTVPSPLELTYRPSPADVAMAQGDASRIRVAEATAGGWSTLECSGDTAALDCTTAQTGVFAVLVASASNNPMDYDVVGGHVFQQANGFGGAGNVGFVVQDDAQAALWTEFQRLGGVVSLGYPIGNRFVDAQGRLLQAFQRGVLQWSANDGHAVALNTLDELSARGLDLWLDAHRQIPPAADASADVGLSRDAVVARHQAMLNGYPALQAAYLADSNWQADYGLPMGVKDYGAFVTARFERTTLQLWKVDEPWATAGSVVWGNPGDLALQTGLAQPTAMLETTSAANAPTS